MGCVGERSSLFGTVAWPRAPDKSRFQPLVPRSMGMHLLHSQSCSNCELSAHNSLLGNFCLLAPAYFKLAAELDRCMLRLCTVGASLCSIPDLVGAP